MWATSRATWHLDRAARVVRTFIFFDYGAALATGSRPRGRRGVSAGGPERRADRGSSYESAPSRNERVLFVLSLVGLAAAAAAAVTRAIHT